MSLYIRKHPILANLLYYLGVGFGLFVLLRPNISNRLSIILDPLKVRPDALQQNFAYWKYVNSEYLQNDYVADYYLNSIIPSGVKFIFAIFGNFFIPPEAASYLSIILAIIFILLLVATSRHLAGNLAGFITGYFAISFLTKNFILADAISRSFGFLVMAFGLYAIVKNKYFLICLSSFLGAVFYPAAGALLAIHFGMITLFPRYLNIQIQNFSLRTRVISLIPYSLILFFLVSPLLLNSQQYGERLYIKNAPEFPEVGLGGRYAPQDLGINKQSLAETIFRTSSKVFLSNQNLFENLQGNPKKFKKNKKSIQKDLNYDRKLIFWSLVIISLGVVFLNRPRSKSSSLKVWGNILILCLALIFSYLLAIVFFPYLYMPSRYPLLAVPILALVLIPAIFQKALSLIKRKSLRLITTVSLLVILVYLSGSISHPGFQKKSLVSNQPIYEFVKELPNNSYLAGWPTGVIDSIPYLTGKKAFVTIETHQVFHQKFLIEMRLRMNSTIDAFFDNSLGSIIKLRDNFGVTHLIFEEHLLGKSKYFAPFNSYLKSKPHFKSNSWKQVFDSNPLRKAIVYKFRSTYIIDLRKI